ncbi:MULTISPECIES: hypothetical protein [unclassified Sphingomonas]|uniref:DUF7668 domain-containing protein n=1 Tax=unclassified Sphingomonas TaxID=196159 RepID=UPI0021513DDE|nr:MULTISPECIES: hypothetical protein [unclassified Sphingomonas]MCR5872512.1 hypothetical protein [Sphingomonas sp. J344]UUX99204.1 hypothetical protein LRS08_17265 [Sphingomonas sp. J315]
MLAKDDDEHPVPPELHATFHKIADAFAAGDYLLRSHAIGGVSAVAPSTAESIATSISAYGDCLAPLNPSTWDHALYRWMGDYCQVLIDLTTQSEEVSDLTLHAKLYDAEPPTLGSGLITTM